MAQSVTRIARPGDVIVDFCSGGVGMTERGLWGRGEYFTGGMGT